MRRPSGENPVKSSGVLRVGTEGVYAPFSYHDRASGELVGYDVDVANAVGEKLGVRVEFVETPWDSIFAALEADRFDVVANQVTINAERKAKYDLSEPYAVGEGVIVTRADDNSITSLADLKGKMAAENATSNWAQVAREAGARVEPVEGFTQAITLLTQGRVDAVVNDSIAVYAYLAEDRRQDRQDRRQTRREERAGLRRPKGQRAAARPQRRARRTEGRRHAGRHLAEVPEGQRAGAPRAANHLARREPVDVAADPAQPVAAGQGRPHQDDPADDPQLRDRPGDRTGGGAGEAVAERDPHQPRPVLHLDHPRDAAAGAVVHRLLRTARARSEDRPVPCGGDRILAQRRRVRRGDHPLGDPEHPQGPVGGGRDDRPELRWRPAADRSAAGRPGRGAAAVEHADLAASKIRRWRRRSWSPNCCGRRRSSPHRRSSSSLCTARPRCTTG